MPKLPRLSGEELIRILERKGYVQVRSRGSHVRLHPPEGSGLKKVTVPLHKELKTGTLSSIMKDTGLITEDLGQSL
jgi:predicted RNA binding protein YcfA (HicA-like mRNA interferase family)